MRAGGHQPEEGRGGSEAFIPAFTAVGGGKGKERVGFGDYGKGAGGSYLERALVHVRCSNWGPSAMSRGLWFLVSRMRGALVFLMCVVRWGEASSRGGEVCWGHGPPSSLRAQRTCAQCDCHLEEGSVCPTSIRAFASLTKSANCRGKDQASSYIGISNRFSNSEFVELETKRDFSVDSTWPALPWSEPRAGVPGGHFLAAPSSAGTR